MCQYTRDYLVNTPGMTYSRAQSRQGRRFAILAVAQHLGQVVCIALVFSGIHAPVSIIIPRSVSDRAYQWSFRYGIA